MNASAKFQSLNLATVTSLLRTKAFGRRLHLLDTTSSTNSEAMTLGQEGAEHGTVVIAEQQTAGRGRLGRHWFSPGSANLYCSVIVRRAPTEHRLSEWLSWLPLVSAVAAARAIQVVTNLLPSLKWPNDILVGHRKVGGLLCETGKSAAQGPFVVIGIGLNVNMDRDEFPSDFRDSATSLAAEVRHPVDRTVLLVSLLGELETHVDSLLQRQGSECINAYSPLCATLGRHVRVNLTDGQHLEGLADSIAADGSLQIIPNDSAARLVRIRAGDVLHLG